MKNNSITIDGITYTFGLMPPTTGVVLQSKLLKIIAPVIALFSEGKGDSSLDTAVRFLSKAFENLSESDIGYILKNLEDFTTVGVKRCSINEDFLGRTLTLYKVLYEFLKYNFADFFALIPNVSNIKENLLGKIISQKTL